MELPDSLVLERYKLALERQNYFTAVARDAFSGFGKLATVVALGAVALVAARDSFGLDSAMMPDLLDLLACTVTLVAVVSAVQVMVAMVRRRFYRRLEVEIDASIPQHRASSWLAEAIYLTVLAVTVFATWEIAGAFAQEIVRTPAAVTTPARQPG